MTGHHCTLQHNAHLTVVQYLCEQDADKEVRDGDGNTYSDVAAAYRSPLFMDQDGDY